VKEKKKKSNEHYAENISQETRNHFFDSPAKGLINQEAVPAKDHLCVPKYLSLFFLLVSPHFFLAPCAESGAARDTKYRHKIRFRLLLENFSPQRRHSQIFLYQFVFFFDKLFN